MTVRFVCLLASTAGALGLAGCSRSQYQGRAVYFGPTAVYRLADGTQEVKPDARSTAFYEQRFNFHPQVNQPLHRIVATTGGAETVYLGLALPPLPPDLAVLAASDSVWTVVQTRPLPGKAQLALLKSRRGEFDVRYVGASAKSGSTHVVNLLTPDSAVARSYFDAEKIFKGNLLL